MKAYRGSRGINPLILNFGARWRSVINITPRLLHPQKEPDYPVQRRVGGRQSQAGHFEGDKNLLALPGFEPRTIQPAAVAPH